MADNARSWHVAGSYFEACNCDVICPCRRQGGQKVASRSTYGVCDFALSWLIRNGSAEATDLAGLKVVMAGSYDDDEEGQPWRVALYVDESADQRQAEALGAIFSGKWGGAALRQFAANIVQVHAVRRAKIALDHRPSNWLIRANEFVEVRAREVVRSDLPVTCGIPGHDRTGDEVLAEVMRVDDAPLRFEVHGRCGYASTFDYRSDEAASR